MHCRVTTRRPAGRPAEEGAMCRVAEEDFPGRGLHLRVALDTEVRVPLVEKFPDKGTMRRVAGHAAFAQRLVGKDVRPALLTMAVDARLVEPCEREATLGFMNVEAMRVMALAAVELAFEHLMVMRQPELRVRLEVAGEARVRRLARVDDELVPPLPSRMDVLAARPVARLTASLSGEARTV